MIEDLRAVTQCFKVFSRSPFDSVRELVIDGSLRDLSGFVQFMENVEYMRMGALLSRMFCTVQSLTIKVPFRSHTPRYVWSSFIGCFSNVVILFCGVLPHRNCGSYPCRNCGSCACIDSCVRYIINKAFGHWKQPKSVVGI